MRSWQGFFHVAVVTFSVWLFRETIFEVLQCWNGRPPSDGLMVGSYILLTGLSCVPIVALHFPDVESAKRFLVLVIATALLFILTEPSFPPPLAHQSDLIKAAHQYSDDMLLYGPIESKPTWPACLLIATTVLLLAAATSAIPIRHTIKFRAPYAVAVGTTLGIYICAEHFPKSQFLHPFIITSVTCGSIFLVFTHLPSASSPRLLPWVFALLVALHPVSYLLEGQLNTASVTTSEGARETLMGLHATLFMLIALQIKLRLASNAGEKAAERSTSQAVSKSGRSSLPAKLRFANQRRASVSIKALTSEAGWTPAVGNISTVLCFVVSLTLNMKLTGGSARSIFLLAPILLLLNQDSGIFTGLGDKRRYFPVAAVTSGYLFLAAVCRIWKELSEGDIGGPGWVFAVKNGGLLTLVSPNHVSLIRFMWDYAKQTDTQLLLLTVPLSLLSVIAADVIPIRVLGLLAVAYSLVQFFVSTRIRIAGMKYI
ncbi:unnamed protein product [Spirodela intermedia]|uniref:Uncharacterized protein n=1 Tax=Spirodela intermedia TaxID=51605 RepID=A0A7I8IQK6_SPIIN|nr:unnamed protein product [Spirodela intermedia]CAA6660072.1 unnamed protein product [Spirodela intermedia]